jgi:hypothetical protein
MVSLVTRETILPPELFQRIAKDSFWHEPNANSRRVPIV